MRKLFYMGLEPYESRYTLQLTDWNKSVFERRKLNVEYVTGDTLSDSKSIETGQVLDAHGRTYYSLTQHAKLTKLMKEGQVTNEDIIYYEDMFTPGIESLPYILQQSETKYIPRIFVRCLAQTIDPDDFVHLWNMYPWMSKYEHMVDSFVSAVIASSEEMVAHMKIAGWQAPIFNCSGLAFGKHEVQSRTPITPFKQRPKRVAFAARWDLEKQPGFFMDMIEKWYDVDIVDNDVEFAIVCGGKFRSNDMRLYARAKELEEKKLLNIYSGLSKNEYYSFLANSRVLFNCALQDWISNTVSEADALGCNVIFPAYRSFPEVFANDHTRLYVPWSVQDAIEKLLPALNYQHPNQGRISDWTNQTIDRIVDILESSDPNPKTEPLGWKWARTNQDYRNHARENKYANSPK